jgi:hypothetical protein
MVQDEKYNWKPENYGLRKGWTGGMMGMMTLVWVVTPEVYDNTINKNAHNPTPPPPGHPPGTPHHHKKNSPKRDSIVR